MLQENVFATIPVTIIRSEFDVFIMLKDADAFVFNTTNGVPIVVNVKEIQSQYAVATNVPPTDENPDCPLTVPDIVTTASNEGRDTDARTVGVALVVVTDAVI